MRKTRFIENCRCYHFHIFIYVPEPEDIGDEEILRRINALYRKASLAQVLGEWTRLKDKVCQ